jgi:hypothetical protein
MEELLHQLFAGVLFTVVVVFTYIGCHMSVEKDAKKHIPLIWEKGGILYNLFNRKSK